MRYDATLAVEHLRLRFGPLHRRIEAALAERKRLSEDSHPAGVSSLCVSAGQAQILAGRCRTAIEGAASAASVHMNGAEHTAEAELRAEAARRGAALPLDELRRALRLTDFEIAATLLCVAPDLEPAYGRLFGFLCDDLNCRRPDAGLVCSLLSGNLAERLAGRRLLGEYAALRRRKVLEPAGQEELRPGARTLAYLCGHGGDAARVFADPAAVMRSGRPRAVSAAERGILERCAEALAADRLRTLALWGPRDAGGLEILLEVCTRSDRPLFSLQALRGVARAEDGDAGAAVLEAAWCEQGCLWLDCDTFTAAGESAGLAALAELLQRSPAPVFLTGARPWRPRALLEAGGYFEYELAAPTFEERRRSWRQLLPAFDESAAESLATRYRLSWGEMQTAARIACERAYGNGHAEPPRGLDAPQLSAACSIVLRRHSAQFADVIVPRRGPDQLILPDELHRRVMELAAFHIASPRVHEDWGFGRLVTGGGGVKAFFSGEPGTGKTLAAEVVAYAVGLPLLRVDLSRVVSKWVGETEKHLDTLFTEAEQSHYVLFLDECDALGGRRGEVRHGADKFANLETAFLLQRLEAFGGLAILASNMKDQLDDALLRRFQVVLHFPLPGPQERRRLWELAFSQGAPVDALVHTGALAQLELTGAGIVNAALSAAMLAASERSGTITLQHILQGVARQFQRESRILSTAQLGELGAQIRAGV